MGKVDSVWESATDGKGGYSTAGHGHRPRNRVHQRRKNCDLGQCRESTGRLDRPGRYDRTRCSPSPAKVKANGAANGDAEKKTRETQKTTKTNGKTQKRK